MESQIQSINFLSAFALQCSGFQPNQSTHQIFETEHVKTCLRSAKECASQAKMRRNVSFNSEVAQKSFSPNVEDQFLDRYAHMVGPTGPLNLATCGYLKTIKLQIPIVKYISWIKKYDLQPSDLEVEIYCLGQAHNIKI